MRTLRPYGGNAKPVGYGLDLMRGPSEIDRPYEIPAAFWDFND